MPFKKGGEAAIRRSLKYLEKGEIVLKDRVKVVTINYSSMTGKKLPNHEGARKFVFWHLSQLQYKNPDVQVLSLRNLTPAPYIICYLDTGEKVVIECDGRSKDEIHDHFKLVMGKSEETLKAETRAREKKSNPANFGYHFNRWCICEVPGQMPCPSWQPLPEEIKGQYKLKRYQDLKDLEKEFEEVNSAEKS
ncbi:small ribosomal subunit protein mS25-like [Lineus longissimus]|uniref:small ribosomal subunit protein mS25-like n=1 Tax=Lineus longissimus TaxID=88925 RepID=UPI002B4E5F76